MAFLDIINIPSIMGKENACFKRANIYDKLDLGLAGVVVSSPPVFSSSTVSPHLSDASQ